MADVYTVTHRQIPWTPASGDRRLPLGRNVHHDSRSLAYRYQHSGQALREVLHVRRIPMLDQGEESDCTTNAGTGAAGTDPLFPALPANHPVLDEAFAVAMYGDEELILFGNRNADEGGDGLTTCKVMQARGLIAGYTHCLSLADFTAALQNGPVLLGCNWYDSMDSPDSSGEVVISPNASLRGAHETVARGDDPFAQTVFIDNSWGTTWSPGLGGSFIMGWGTLERLLSEQGDGTVPVPLTAPAPVPVPIPPVPIPPGPVPASLADQALAATAEPWIAHRHEGSNKRMATALRTWLAAKGF